MGEFLTKNRLRVFLLFETVGRCGEKKTADTEPSVLHTTRERKTSPKGIVEQSKISTLSDQGMFYERVGYSTRNFPKIYLRVWAPSSYHLSNPARKLESRELAADTRTNSTTAVTYVSNPSVSNDVD